MITVDFIMILPPRMKTAELIFSYTIEKTAMALENNNY